MSNSALPRDQLLLILALLLAFFLRVHDLDTESLWLDEGISIKVAHFSLSQIVEDRISNAHLPTYFLILHYWVNLSGDSEFSVRFLSVIFGVLAIPIVYRVGSLLFDKKVGIISALLLGITVFHIYYSQEARGYSLIACLTLISMFFFIKTFRQRSLITAIAYILSTTLLLYTHSATIFVILAQNVYVVTLLLASKKVYPINLKDWALQQFVLLVLFLPWLGIFINQILKVQKGYWIPVPSIKTLTDTFKVYSSDAFSILLIFLALSSLSIITCRKVSGSIEWRDFFRSIEDYSWNIGLSNVNKVYLLLVWLLTPIVIPFVISRLSTPIYISRITISASLAFYLLVAKGIKNINQGSVQSVIIGVIIVLSLFNVREYYTEVTREQWRETANYIDINAKQGDLLLFNAGFTQNDIFDYYSQKRDLIKKPFPEETKEIFYLLTTSEEDIKQLRPTVEDHNRVWLILSHSRDRNGLITKALSETYNLSYHDRYVGIEIYLFEQQGNNQL